MDLVTDLIQTSQERLKRDVGRIERLMSWARAALLDLAQFDYDVSTQLTRLDDLRTMSLRELRDRHQKRVAAIREWAANREPRAESESDLRSS